MLNADERKIVSGLLNDIEIIDHEISALEFERICCNRDEIIVVIAESPPLRIAPFPLEEFLHSQRTAKVKALKLLGLEVE